MNTMANCANCGHQLIDHTSTKCWASDGRCDCKSPAPTQSEASEPAEDFEIKPINTYRLNVPIRYLGEAEPPDFNDEPAASQQAPADHPDLAAEVKAFMEAAYLERYGYPFWEDQDSAFEAGFNKALEYAQHKLQAQSPAAIIDEFVERLLKREGNGMLSMDAKEFVRSVAEEMKRK